MKEPHCKCCNRPVKCRGMCKAHYERWKAGKRGEELEAPVRDYGLGEVDLLDNSGPELPKLVYDTEWKRFAEWIGIRAERRPKYVPLPKDKHILHGVISDSHSPFHDLDCISEAVDWMFKEGVQVLHLVGDVNDHYGLSRFLQYEPVPIQHEAIETRKILDLFSRSFAEVYVMSGNHEARELKYLAARLPPDLVQWYAGKGFIARLTEDMPNVHIVSRTVEGTVMKWVAPVGKDLVLAHAESASKIPMRAADNVRHWLDSWHETIGVENRPRVIMQAHTHSAGVTPVGKQIIVELGCTCKIQGYALQPNLYPKPQVQAATVFEQREQVTLLNSIRQRYLKVA